MKTTQKRIHGKILYNPYVYRSYLLPDGLIFVTNQNKNINSREGENLKDTHKYIYMCVC